MSFARKNPNARFTLIVIHYQKSVLGKTVIKAHIVEAKPKGELDVATCT